MLVRWPLVLFNFRAVFGRVTWLSLFFFFSIYCWAKCVIRKETICIFLKVYVGCFFMKMNDVLWEIGSDWVLKCSEGCCTNSWSWLHMFMGQVNSFYRCGLEKERQGFVLMLKMFRTSWKHLNFSMNAKLALKGSTKRILFAGPVRPVFIHTLFTSPTTKII